MNTGLTVLGITFILMGLLVFIFFYKVTFGSVLSILLGIGLVGWNILGYLRLKGFYEDKIELLRKGLFILFILWLISFIIIEGLILTGVNPDQEAQVDYVVILGAGLRGEIPSLSLHTRLMKGLEYLNQQPELKVIVSGGQGPGETITEAEAMKRFLVKKGIHEDRIIKEDQSTSTVENLLYSKEKLDNGEGKRVMIVTSDFHIFRSKYLAKKVGFEPYGIPAKTPFYLWMDYSVREYFAILKSFILD